MSNVYIVVALTAYASSTVMAAFDDEDAAHRYLDDYQRHQGAESGPAYKPTYDDYEILPVELNATPFRYGDLASHRSLGLT